MPGPLPRTKSNGWWNQRWAYRIVVLREFSAFAVAGYMVLLLLLVSQVRGGESAFADYLDVLKNPLLWIIHAVILGFAQLHTSTWFRLMPKATPLKLGGWRVPDDLITAGAYGGWLAVSVVVLLIFLVVA